MHGSNAVRDDIGNEETEEQPHMVTTDAHLKRMPTAYEGRRDWDTGHKTSPAMCPTQCAQPRASTDMHGSNAVRDDIGNEETEEQPQMLTTNAHFNRSPTAYEGKRDWDTGHQTSPAMCLTQCTQPRVSTDMQPLQEESQMFEMSFQSTDLPAPVVERSMWHDFTAAVRD